MNTRERIEKRNEQKSPQRRFLFILGVTMFTLYFVLGLLIIFWDAIPTMLGLSKTYKIAFGLILIIYSFVRFIRLINQQRA